jgi:hypothetical protein
MLDTQDSNDLGVWTAPGPGISGNDNGFESAAYQLPSTAGTTVSGVMNASTGHIYFRIGLRSQNNTGAPRYGIVLLTYKNHDLSRRIFIRQGEDPDFVMRNTDAVLSGPFANQTRTATQKFSPYNLTYGPFNTSGWVQTPLYGGTFTDYPSQAGAFFQWASPNRQRYAWAPYTVTTTSWSTQAIGGFWNTHQLIHEACPLHYRRPNDGSISAPTNGGVAGSEMRQSLWLNPMTGDSAYINSNYAWGYYADGFFDRRQIVHGTGDHSASSSAVAVSSVNVAYIGSLYFNPDNGASIFFPAAGFRFMTTGALGGAGALGYYWTSSSGDSFGNSWAFGIVESATGQVSADRGYGFSIRCVAQ